jgi:hypothetical protein
MDLSVEKAILKFHFKNLLSLRRFWNFLIFSFLTVHIYLSLQVGPFHSVHSQGYEDSNSVGIC